jgi:hypothetical protein
MEALEAYDSHRIVGNLSAPVRTVSHLPKLFVADMTTVSYPGSVRNASADPAQSRYGRRKPQSYTYAPYYPPLQYNQAQGDFYGGNFWDLRATGVYLQNPAAEQAQDPPCPR